MTIERLRKWSDRSFVAFLGLGFVIPGEPTWALWFYLFVMPFGVWFIWRGWQPDWNDPRLMLLLGLVVWSTLSIAWADQSAPGALKQWLWVWNGVCTATYLLTFTAVAEQSSRVRDRIVVTVVTCAAGNAVLSIVMFLTRHGGSDRLQGFGETRNAILGASIMGLCTIMALGRAMRGGRWWPLWAGSVPVYLFFVVLTNSRGPLLALVISCLVLLPRRRVRTYLAGAAMVAVVGVGIVLLAPAVVDTAIQRIQDRGTSYRLEIWQASIAEIWHRPLLGHGITATLRIQGEFGHHPHDLYLSALFYTGLVGLLLLLAGLGWILRDLLKRPDSVDRRTCLALLVHLVLSGATDLSQITKGPGELWYIVWLPIAYTLGYLRDPAGQDQSRPRINAKAWATVAARIPERSPGKI